MSLLSQLKKLKNWLVIKLSNLQIDTQKSLQKNTVIILRSIPGAGKSYLAEQLYQQAKSQNLTWIVCSADHFFVDSKGNYNWNPKFIGKAHEVCREKFVQALLDDIDIIVVDNTNTTIKEMQFYVDWARTRDYYIEFIEPDTSWKFNATECAKKNRHNVPLQSIQKMLDRYVHNVTLENFPCTNQETKSV